MSQSVYKHLLEQTNQQQEEHKQDVLSRLYDYMSEYQKQFIFDPHRFKIARCSRRAGKSFGFILYSLYKMLENPGFEVLFLGLTRESAMDAIWRKYVDVLEEFGIEYHPTQSKGLLEFPNGSYFKIFGADARNAISRLRGPDWGLVGCDEMGFVRSQSADDLIDALIPTLADSGGTLCMLSSPGPVLEGFFFEADIGSQKENWSRYHWTLRDNPIFQGPANNSDKYPNRAEEELDTICKLKYGGDWNDPVFRREWLGEWCRDSRSLVYPYHQFNSIYSYEPFPRKHYVIGINVSDPRYDAACVIQYSDMRRDVQVVYSEVLRGKDVDEFIDRVLELSQIYDPDFITAFKGKYKDSLIDELVKRYSLPISETDERDLEFFKRLVATDMKHGHIRLTEDAGDLDTEWKRISKDVDNVEIAGQDNFASNAFLGAYRKVYNTHIKSFEPPATEEELHIKQLERKLSPVYDELDDFDSEVSLDDW